MVYFPVLLSMRRRQWHPTPVLLPGKSHGRRSLVGCNPWGCKESDTTEWLHFHFSLSCIGEGNGNPLQCSCLKNPGDRGAWWAAVYGVAQSWTRLKWLSSSIVYEWPILKFEATIGQKHPWRGKWPKKKGVSPIWRGQVCQRPNMARHSHSSGNLGFYVNHENERKGIVSKKNRLHFKKPDCG